MEEQPEIRFQEEISLTLLLSPPRTRTPRLPSPPPLPPHQPLCSSPPPRALVAQKPSTSRSVRTRRNPTQSPHGDKSDIVPQPYAWATNQRARLHSLDYLLLDGIHTVSGEVQCKKCENLLTIEFGLREKFEEIAAYIVANKGIMHERAPKCWMSPEFPNCRRCGCKGSMKPVMASKKREINWLFLLLGKYLGFCTLEQLKYFCKHNQSHRTAAKDRLLYLTYLGLCKQLEPTGPFDR